MRSLFVSSNEGRRRRKGRTLTRAYLPGEGGFEPRHCAGTTCMHDHAGEPDPWTNFHRAFAAAEAAS